MLHDVADDHGTAGRSGPYASHEPIRQSREVAPQQARGVEQPRHPVGQELRAPGEPRRRQRPRDVDIVRMAFGELLIEVETDAGVTRLDFERRLPLQQLQ